jgi:hypothetical protein
MVPFSGIFGWLEDAGVFRFLTRVLSTVTCPAALGRMAIYMNLGLVKRERIYCKCRQIIVDTLQSP